MAASGARGGALREAWLESLLLAGTVLGREKSMRFVMYFSRTIEALTGQELFARLMATMAVCRKSLRFYKPLAIAKAAEDVIQDPHLDSTEKTLTLAEKGSDAVYAVLDHVTFFQRIGGLSWLTPKQVDNLDRFIEVFWLTEIAALVCREARALFRALRPDNVRDSREPVLGVAPSVSAAAAQRLREAKLLLFKAIVLDLPCCGYAMMPATAKKAAWRLRAGSGALGALASILSLQMAWPRGACRGKIM